MLRQLTLLTFIIIGSLSFYSCGDDGEVVMENPNEQFFGDYSGTFTCPGVFASINDSAVEFSITPPPNANDVNKVTVATNISGIPISLEGDVSGNSLTFSDLVIENVEVSGITTDVTFSGSALLNGNDLTATLAVGATVLGASVSDNCSYVGSKQ